MLQVALVQTRSRALAEEAVQDTWLAVLQGIDGFEGRASALAWPWSQPPRAWAPVPDAAVLGTELRSLLDDAIAVLPDRQRLVLTLRDADGCTTDEVCDLLDITPGNQRVLLHRARTAVRAALTPYLAQGTSWRLDRTSPATSWWSS
jgi:RNA polymerase sigma-70 factor (ECF subfamily)